MTETSEVLDAGRSGLEVLKIPLDNLLRLHDAGDRAVASDRLKCFPLPLEPRCAFTQPKGSRWYGMLWKVVLSFF